MNKSFYLVTSTLLMASCQSYKELNLAPGPILEKLESQRQEELSETFSFSEAAALMEKNNLELKQVRKEYETLQKVAELKTPWLNPSITAGPAFGSDSGLSDTGSAYSFVSLGFSIPLGPRLRRNDDLNQINALTLYNEQVLTHRQLFFELEQAWVDFTLNKKLLLIQEKISQTLNLTTKTAEKLIEVGTATRLGVTSIKLQEADLQLTKIDQHIRVLESVASLSNLLVVAPSQLDKVSPAMQPTPRHELTLGQLKDLLLANNPDLARSEMRFHQLDAELRLELAKQYPDLNVGFDAEEEVGDTTNTFSFPFSIELPLFDRNQQAIRASFGARESELINYNKILNEKLSELNKLFKQHSMADKKVKYYKSILLPLSRRQLEDAKTSLDMGAIDILRYLDLLNESLQIELQSIELQSQAWNYFVALQELVGQSLNEVNNSSFTKSQFKSMEQ